VSIKGIEPGDVEMTVPIAVMEAQAAASLSKVLVPTRIPGHSARIVVTADSNNSSLAHLGLGITPRGVTIILR